MQRDPLISLPLTTIGPGRLGHLIFVVRAPGLPQNPSGLCLERNLEGVVGREKNLVIVDREIPVSVIRPRQAPDVGRQLPSVLPEKIAGRCVESLDDVFGIGEKHDPVVDKRFDFLRPRLHGHRPHQAQLAHVRGVDLVQRAVAPEVVSVAEADPVFGSWPEQHVIGDRHEPFSFSGTTAGIDGGTTRCAATLMPSRSSATLTPKSNCRLAV